MPEELNRYVDRITQEALSEEFDELIAQHERELTDEYELDAYAHQDDSCYW